MPADTTTTILGLLLQGTGNNNNNWGTNLNNSVITPLENAVAGANTITGLTGGAYTLTQANAAYAVIALTGTLTSDLTITVPSVAHTWHFLNAITTGAFYVLVKTAAGAAVNLPHGKTTQVYTDSVNMFRGDRERVGEYFFHAGLTVPGGALECNGQTPLRASVPDLFGALGGLHGVGNGTTTFTLPDGYTAGKFLRSRTASVAVAIVQTNQNKAHTHTFSGSLALGSLGITGSDGGHTHTGGTTDGESVNHTHTYAIPNSKVTPAIVSNGASTFFWTGDGGNGNTGNDSANHTHTFSVPSNNSGHNHAIGGIPGLGTLATVTDGGTEARPENISGILCVRY